MNRIAKIRKQQIEGEESTMFVVDLFENDQLVQTRELPGKSRHYAQDVVENWESGLIQLLID